MEQAIEQTPNLLKAFYCDFILLTFWLTIFNLLLKTFWRQSWQLTFCLNISGSMAVILYILAKYCKCSNIFSKVHKWCTPKSVSSVSISCPEKGQISPSPTNRITGSHGFHCEATSASFCKVFTLTPPPSLLYVPATSYKWPGWTSSLRGPGPS